MKSTEKDRFTFREIAEQWVREIAGTPSALSRDEILHGLLRSVWRGDFEDEDGENTCLAIHRYPKGGARRINGKFVDADHQRTAETRPLGVNRRWLPRALALDRPHGLPLPPGDKLDPWSRPESDDPKAAMRDPALWSEVKAEVRWDILDALTLDEYSHMFRTAYLEPLTISKEDFGRWCDDHEHPRPAFWFEPSPGEEPGHRPPSTDKLQLRTKAEAECYSWLVEIGRNEKPTARNTKGKLYRKAHQKFGVSRRAFDGRWQVAMPSTFKAPGVRKTGS